MNGLDWEEWKDFSLGSSLESIRADHSFMPMGRATFNDALWCQEGCGIYVFHDDAFNPWYIGKVASRSFLERISGHLDTHAHKGGGHTGWFNTFHQRWSAHLEQPDEIAKCAYMSCVGLLILRMPHGDKSAIGRVERTMIHTYDPALNRKTQIGKRSKYFPLLEKLDECTVEAMADYTTTTLELLT